MAILMNDAPAAELSNLCDIVAGLDAWLAAQRVSWHAKLSEGEGGNERRDGCDAASGERAKRK